MAIPNRGDPLMSRICTSHVERLNASTRLYMKWLNRLTLAFSKSSKTVRLPLLLRFAAYNFFAKVIPTSE
jgi:IS1 family transposase